MNLAEDVSARPYLLRAIYEWCAEKKYTPYLAADSRCEDAQIPASAGGSGNFVVFNISSDAVRDLTIGEEVSFTARFHGVTSHVILPARAITGIYARETGSGLSFAAPTHGTEKPVIADDKPDLRII